MVVKIDDLIKIRRTNLKTGLVDEREIIIKNSYVGYDPTFTGIRDGDKNIGYTKKTYSDADISKNEITKDTKLGKFLLGKEKGKSYKTNEVNTSGDFECIEIIDIVRSNDKNMKFARVQYYPGSKIYCYKVIDGLILKEGDNVFAPNGAIVKVIEFFESYDYPNDCDYPHKVIQEKAN